MRFEVSNVLAFLFLSAAIVLIVRSRHKEHGAEKKWAYFFLMAGAFLFMMSLASLLLP